MVTCQCGLQRLPSLKLDRLRTNGAPCGLRRADGLETCLLRPQQETGPRVVRSRSLLRPAGLWSINGGRPFSFMLAFNFIAANGDQHLMRSLRLTFIHRGNKNTAFLKLGAALFLR